MAAKKPAASSSKAKPAGRAGRLFRVFFLLLGLFCVGVLVDYVVTARAMQGRWRFHAPELSDATVETMMDRAAARSGEENPGRRLPPKARSMLTQLGNKVVGAVSSKVVLEVVDGGYRFDNPVAARAAGMLMGARGGAEASLSGCMSGTWIAAFPLARVTCGDGSGRRMWFLMKGWPSAEVRFLPLPIGNEDMRHRMKELAGDGVPSSQQLAAADELMTLRFTREPAP